MENQKRARNELGQFKKAETLFQAEKPSDGIVEASKPIEAQLTIVNEYDQIKTIRGELKDLIDSIPEKELLDVIETPQVPQETGGEISVVADKVLKKTQKELKEKAPKIYDEKLLYLSDTQLIDLTHQENFGAILQYLNSEAKTFTHVVLGGDIFDFTQQASFPKDNSEGDRVTTDELEAGKWFIGWINDRFSHTKRVFTKGNHEHRYKNMYENSTNGVKQWLVPFTEMFHLEDWEMYEYGQGQSYDWHGVKMWHGEKGGPKQNTPKLEVERAFRSVTFGHSPYNKSWEAIDADGNILRGNQHAGVSDHPEYSKSGYKSVSDGFGVYYYSRVKGKDVINGYSVSVPINNPMFLSPEGKLFDGTGFNLRKEIGLETRGRPRK